MLRHRTQFDGRRQRLADHHPLLNHDRAVARESGNHSVWNFQAESNSRADGSADNLAYLVKYDSTQGRFQGEVSSRTSTEAASTTSRLLCRCASNTSRIAAP